MVQLAQARVELSICRADQQSCSDCGESVTHLEIDRRKTQSLEELYESLPANLGAGSP